MKKLLYSFFWALFPVLAFAADPDLPSAYVPGASLPGGGLSFAPPPGDYSVIFLGDIFGLVDGVLFGTGSQIMGDMFGVFNAAVLALGGIIIIYTLMVSTMNTAHEGQFLGQKWSSIWIPVRSTIGLALLIPKASGYCLMQIFVMWVVVQGIGAADKIWATALSYLNSGGVIIRAQQPSPVEDLINGGTNPTFNGAYTILAGQVCMLGLQEQLNTVRKKYLAQPKETSYCKTSKVAEAFCKNNIPDFAASIDFMKAESLSSPFRAEMPSFPANSPYAFLNGICGVVQWEAFNKIKCAPRASQGLAPANPSNGKMQDLTNLTDPQFASLRTSAACDILSESEANTLGKSRAAALMTMYNSLLPVANVIVKNNPLLGPPPPNNQLTPINYSAIAAKGFGVPYSAKGAPCKQYSDNCTNWGNAPGAQTGFILSGVQFLNAVQSYNGIMAPTLNLTKQITDMDTARNSRAFISKANSQGWMMAGAYFFDLIKLNGNAGALNVSDKDNGLDKSTNFNRDTFLESFAGGTDKSSKTCSNKRTDLCEWFQKDDSKLIPVAGMIDGIDFAGGTADPPKFKVEDANVLTDKRSATVNGFVQNAIMVRLPGQPGLEAPSFVKLPTFKIQSDLAGLPKITDFDCGYVFLLGCFGRALGDFFYNSILRPLHKFFLDIFGSVIQAIVNAFIMVPLTVMSTIFIQGMDIVSQKGVNPIVALSKMGEHYINAAGNMWINMLTLSISTSIIPVIGKFIFALMGLGMPLVIAWLSVMMGVGFVTCYYIPLLPYLIFTFASIGWLIAVIEAMVAAPLVALGVTHPEGHDAFGKGEHAVMIIMNVFLRPAMMIIGYIAAIALCYVGVWILNAGFGHAIEYIVGVEVGPKKDLDSYFGGLGDWGDSLREEYAPGSINKSFSNTNQAFEHYKMLFETAINDQERNAAFRKIMELDNLSEFNRDYANRLNERSRVQGNAYVSWAGIYAFFFAILSYTSAYLTIVQKSFTLIHLLPDKVLRWIGGQPEGIGGETAGWAEESKKSIETGGEKTSGGQAKIAEKLGAGGDKLVSGAKNMLSGSTDDGDIGVDNKK